MGASDLSMFREPLSGNQVYSFHMYTWFGDRRRKNLADYKRISDAQGVPLWCGEFGENKYEIIRSTVELFEDPQYGLGGWSFYTWKRSGKGGRRYPGLVIIETPESWQRVIESVGTVLRRRAPSRPQARQGMRDLIASLQRRAQSEDPRMVDAPVGASRNGAEAVAGARAPPGSGARVGSLSRSSSSAPARGRAPTPMRSGQARRARSASC